MGNVLLDAIFFAISCRFWSASPAAWAPTTASPRSSRWERWPQCSSTGRVRETKFKFPYNSYLFFLYHFFRPHPVLPVHHDIPVRRPGNLRGGRRQESQGRRLHLQVRSINRISHTFLRRFTKLFWEKKIRENFYISKKTSSPPLISPDNRTSPSFNASGDDPCWPGGDSPTRFSAYRVALALFVCVVGPFAFCDVQKTKYLQILTTLMRWLAFAFMVTLATIRWVCFTVVDLSEFSPSFKRQQLFGFVEFFELWNRQTVIFTPIFHQTVRQVIMFFNCIFRFF